MFYEKTVLNDGVTVLSEHMDGVRSITLGFWVRTGSRDETPEIYGMSHFMEHMLFKGTPSRSAIDISMAFDSIGAELNAFTSREYTCFYCRLMDQHLNSGFEILADMLVNAAFTQDTIEPEREVVIEEIARGEDGPEDLVYDVFSDAMFPTHPLGRPVLGTRETVSSFVTEDMKGYHRNRYTSGNVVVVASGSVDHDVLVALAQRWLEGLPVGPRHERAAIAERNRKSLSVVTKDSEQAHILYGMPSVALDSPKRFAYRLLDSAMGGGMSSRLFNEIREKRGLVYAVYTMSQMYEDAGQFMMYAGTRPDNVREILDVTRSEFAKMANEGIEKEEFERVKELVCGNFVLGMESTRSHMIRLGKSAIHGLEIRSLDEILDSYRNVTIDGVNDAARELLTIEPTLAIVSPYAEKDIERMIS